MSAPVRQIPGSRGMANPTAQIVVRQDGRQVPGAGRLILVQQSRGGSGFIARPVAQYRQIPGTDYYVPLAIFDRCVEEMSLYNRLPVNVVVFVKRIRNNEEVLVQSIRSNAGTVVAHRGMAVASRGGRVDRVARNARF